MAISQSKSLKMKKKTKGTNCPQFSHFLVFDPYMAILLFFGLFSKKRKKGPNISQKARKKKTSGAELCQAQISSS